MSTDGVSIEDIYMKWKRHCIISIVATIGATAAALTMGAVHDGPGIS